MLLCPQPLPSIPAETARLAHAAFPKGHPYLRAADELGEVFTNRTFAALFPRRGQPAAAPSDRSAADAVRARLDRKYVLQLAPDDAGFDASVRCEFRGRPAAGGVAALRHAADVVPDAAVGQGAGAAAHRLDAGARRHPRAPSGRDRR